MRGASASQSYARANCARAFAELATGGLRPPAGTRERAPNSSGVVSDTIPAAARSISPARLTAGETSTGRPAASASITAIVKASVCEESAQTSVAASARSLSSPRSSPVKTTRSPTPSFSASASSPGRSFSSSGPAMTRSASGCRRAAIAKDRMSRSSPFFFVSLPRKRTTGPVRPSRKRSRNSDGSGRDWKSCHRTPLGRITVRRCGATRGASLASSSSVKWIAAARRSIRLCHMRSVSHLRTRPRRLSHGSRAPWTQTT